MGIIIANGEPRRLNYRRQPVDLRDIHLHNAQAMTKRLPAQGTTTKLAKPAIRNQGQVGSCTNNAGAAALAFLYMTLTKTSTDPLFSRLFGYYWTRFIEGTPESEDSGCSVRDVFKAYTKYGLCLEKTWPYDEQKFSVKPTVQAIAEGVKYLATMYYACVTLQAIKQSISDGYPVIFGFDCFESLESEETAKTGLIPMPEETEASIGGHCMYADTYDDNSQEISGNNSWGEDWGIGGRFRLPYGYWTHNYASDGSTVRAEKIIV